MFKCSRFFIRDGALVGDLRDALKPMIWRMDLAQASAVSFRVLSKDGTWDLGLEAPHGDFVTIASYADEKTAQRALRRLGFGLRASGWVRRGLGMIFAGVLALLLVYVMWVVIAAGGAQMSASQATVQSAPAPANVGKPLSADQALRVPAP